MQRKRSLILLGLFLAVLVVTTSTTSADSAAQIFDAAGLRYVKHVNNLPAGVTTLWVRSLCNTGLARISFEAQVEGKVNVSKTIFANFRHNEEKKFVIDWGTPITDLNFIEITPVRASQCCAPGARCP